MRWSRTCKQRLALIVLGGSHDLGSHLADDMLYVQVTPRSYPNNFLNGGKPPEGKGEGKSK